MDSSEARVFTASKNLKQIKPLKKKKIRRQLACLDCSTSEVYHERWYPGFQSHYMIAVLKNNLNYSYS